jgi:hypothetical protein
MAKIDLLVSVEDGYMNRLSEVAKDLENAGMNVEQKLGEIGVLTGSINSAEKVELLRKVKGVANVEESRQIQIAPPDSPIQ